MSSTNKIGTVLNIMVWQTLLNVIFPIATVSSQSCNYYQDMVLGQSYYIYNSEYPSTYKPGHTCTWNARSPGNSKIYLSCEDIDIPSSQYCQQDRLSISLSGDPSFADAQNYCGQGKLSLTSNGNSIAIGIFASYYSTGGKFLCTITAVADATTTTERPSQCDCGWTYQKRIVGGIETGINEFPYMAAIYHITKKTIHCGASIISTNYVLSAAHCLSGDDVTTNTIALVVGDHDLSTGVDTDAATVYLFQGWHINEHYNDRKKQDDIALLKTINPIVFSDRVGPVCLPFKFADYNFDYEYVTMLGWGFLDVSGPMARALQKVSVQVQPLVNCRYNVTTDEILDTAMCTFAKDKDACTFDSGGPALYSDYFNGRNYLAGIISYGKGCASNTYAVNTRVTSFLEWIVSNTQDAQYCIRS